MMGSRRLLFLWLVLTLGQNAAADGFGLDTLLPILAQNSGGRARFSEQKFIS